MNRSDPPVWILLLMSALSAFCAAPARAQHTVIQSENVRYEYAKVLKVTPVYQVLTATSVEQQCDPPEAPATGNTSRLSRMVGAVRDALTRENRDNPAPSSGQGTTPQGKNCRSVPVSHEFRRPIAYDVDYDYKGSKYRSRLPDDPGNRLQVRVSVTPVIGSDPR